MPKQFTKRGDKLIITVTMKSPWVLAVMKFIKTIGAIVIATTAQYLLTQVSTWEVPEYFSLVVTAVLIGVQKFFSSQSEQQGAQIEEEMPADR